MIQQYIEEFSGMPEAGIPWLDKARKDSILRFEKNGFPTQRLEEWKDINLSPVVEKFFKTPTQRLAPFVSENAIWKNIPRIIFNNGFCEGITANIEGVTVQNLSDALKNDSSLVSFFESKIRYQHSIMDLNNSMARTGVVIRIGKNVNVEEPIYLIYQSSSSEQAHHYRNLILAESFSKVKIVEIFLSSEELSANWTIPVTQIQAGPNSNVEHVVIQDQSLSSAHTGVVLGQLERNSRVSTHSFSFGGKIVRNDIHMVFNGEGAECTMNGLYVASQSQVMDHHTSVDHAKPHCSSFETYKGVLMDQSHGIFEGKIIVAEGALKTDAKQMNQNLLLSSLAKINTAPQLEILADDVKCSHGATIGKLDEDQIFYLRSRGIPLKDARLLLISAYVEEIVSGVSNSEVKEYLQKIISQKIGKL